MRLLFAIALVVLALLLAALLFWVRPTWAETPRCLTYQEKAMGRLQSVCDDGTRAVSTWNRTLERWESTVIPLPPNHWEKMLPQPKALRR